MVDKKKELTTSYDYMILLPTIFLIVLGLLMVYSTSSNMAARQMGDSYFFFKRQALFCVFGLGVMILAKHTPVNIFFKLTYPLLIISIILLAALYIPGIGHTVGGACRWIRIGHYSIQPSEFAKFTLVLYISYSIRKRGLHMGTFSKGILPHIIVTVFFMALILYQPDLGTAAIIASCTTLSLFVGGAKTKHIIYLILSSSCIAYFLILGASYRIERILAYLDPWKYPHTHGFQIIHSFLAFGSGGIFGEGLGESKQKLFYLPEAHTDFILPIAGEELGFIGVLIIIFLFGCIILRGFKITLEAKDLYNTYLAFSLTTLFGLQVLINMAVVMGLLPTKGLALPFLSYGGSSLVTNLLIIGILLNISSKNKG